MSLQRCTGRNRSYSQLSSTGAHERCVCVCVVSKSMYVYLQYLFTEEMKSSAVELGASWTDEGVEDGITLTPETKVKLIRYGAVRYLLLSMSLRSLDPRPNPSLTAKLAASFCSIPKWETLGTRLYHFFIVKLPTKITLQISSGR